MKWYMLIPIVWLIAMLVVIFIIVRREQASRKKPLIDRIREANKP